MTTKTGDILNMVAFLGVGIQVHKKSGSAFYFKPFQFMESRIGDRDLDAWIGTDDEGQNRAVLRMDIDFVKYN